MTELMSQLPCLKCGSQTSPAMPDPDSETPPADAMLFISYGNYGSRVFDSVLADEYLLAVICDRCVTQAGEKGIVLHCRRENFTLVTIRERWQPP